MTSNRNTRPAFPITLLALLTASSGCSMANWTQKLATPQREQLSARAQTKASMKSAIESNREQALLLAAETRWSDDDPADCERLLNRLLENNPDCHVAQRMLAELYLSTGRPQLALREFQYLLDREPNSLELQYQCAAALEASGHPAEAGAMFERVAASASPESWLAATPNRGAQGMPIFRDQPINTVVPVSHDDQRPRFLR
jgi:predicted Zn-dependent protease